VGAYPKKLAAVAAAHRVHGVLDVVDDMRVRIRMGWERTDQEIATACANALKEHVLVPAEKVQVTVAKGWVDLEGEVEWHFQRTAAQNAICHLTGVKNVSNRVLVKPRFTASDLKTKIEKAFKRTAELDARTIDVKTSSGNVTLSGTVRSTAERDEASRVAWSAPGVLTVENRILVR
jgi:osmotically-inducible protein OsmY